MTVYFNQRDYYEARCEHAWRLRQDRFKIKEIGERLGVHKSRASQLVHSYQYELRQVLVDAENKRRLHAHEPHLTYNEIVEYLEGKRT